MKTANQVNIENIFNRMVNCSKVAEYAIVESYMHPGLKTGISNIKNNAESIDDAMRVAHSNRRNENTLLEIFLDGRLIASQENIESSWTYSKSIQPSVNVELMSELSDLLNS